MNENDKRAELILARAQGVLEDLPLRQLEIHAALGTAQRQALSEQLGQVAEQLRAAQDELALLHAASDLLSVVENQPTLRKLLLPPAGLYDDSAPRREAWLEEWERPPGVSPEDNEHWQKLVALRNIMVARLEEQIAALLKEADDAHR